MVQVSKVNLVLPLCVRSRLACDKCEGNRKITVGIAVLWKKIYIKKNLVKREEKKVI